MRIAVMGSGALGGYFGAKLARGGADVTFIARGAHLAALQSAGIMMEGGVEPFRVSPVRATDDPASIGPVDLVLFAVKLWDTEIAARAVLPLIGPETALVSFQNGVLKDEMLRAMVPERALMGGVSYVATTLARPGVIAQTGALERLIFGEFDGGRSPRAERFLAACQAGGIKAEFSNDIVRDIWEKYVFLVGLSGTTTAMRATMGPIRENPQTRAFLLDLMREVVAVGRALGVDLPVEYADDRLRLADSIPYEMTSSMHHDLQRGHRLEVPWLSGGVVQLGRRAGVATPLNRAVADALALWAEGRPSA